MYVCVFTPGIMTKNKNKGMNELIKKSYSKITWKKTIWKQQLNDPLNIF